MTTPRTPIRRCVACGSRRPQAELRRFRAVDGSLVEGAGPGRGAYTCRGEDCLARALQRNLFPRRLRAPAAGPSA